MSEMKSEAINQIDRKMKDMDDGSLRYRVLKNAKDFKTSWVELGQALYSVWKEKLYTQWGYLTFDAYTSKEIGIRKQTALKLLRSYSFLEREADPYLRQDYVESAEASSVPGYESIDLLRKAKKGLDGSDYEKLRKDVFEKGKEPREVRRDLTSLITQREELEPEEARRKKKIATVKRLLGALRALHRHVEMLKLLPAADLAEIQRLMKRIEDEVT